MANIAIVVVVPSPESPDTAWDYHVYGPGIDPIPESHILPIPSGTDLEIMVTLVAGGQLTDTCDFPVTPLSFFDEGGNPMTPPGWFQDLQSLDTSTIVFKDDNTNLMTQSYAISINALYNGETPITSPDPTIVNEGTNGLFFHFPVRLPQPQPQLAAVAV